MLKGRCFIKIGVFRIGMVESIFFKTQGYKVYVDRYSFLVKRVNSFIFLKKQIVRGICYGVCCVELVYIVLGVEWMCMKFIGQGVRKGNQNF